RLFKQAAPDRVGGRSASGLVYHSSLHLFDSCRAMISRVFSTLSFPALWWRRAAKLVALGTLCVTGELQAAPAVLASIKPLQLIAAAITDGVSTPQLVMDGGHDPHHITLRPSDRRKLQQADLVL